MIKIRLISFFKNLRNRVLIAKFLIKFKFISKLMLKHDYDYYEKYEF